MIRSFPAGVTLPLLILALFCPGAAQSAKLDFAGGPDPLSGRLLPGLCLTSEEPDSIDLTQFWDALREREAGYRGVAESLAAELAVRSSVRRELAPSLALEGLGNWGQRLSPGEERVLGAGPRGEFRLLGTWTLLDSDRRWRGIEADRRVSEATAGGEVFDQAVRAASTALYLEAALTEAVWEARRDHLGALRALAEPVRLRIEEGLDVQWEVHLLDEALARSERLFAEADQSRAGLRAELSALAGRCVRPASLDFQLEAPLPARNVHENPAVVHLLRQAETREALAGAEGDRGRWQLHLLGTTGPTYSRAFPDNQIQNEYLVGIGASWRPDLAGARRQLSLAEGARAAALRSEAESLAFALERGVERITLELEYAESRRDALEREQERAHRREEAALLRWEEGVDRWTEVLQARDRVQETRLLHVDWMREVGLALIRWGEGAGALDEIPARFGQGSAR